MAEPEVIGNDATDEEEGIDQVQVVPGNPPGMANTSNPLSVELRTPEPRQQGVESEPVTPLSGAAAIVPAANDTTPEASRVVTREDLLEQGVPSDQADAILVRMHEDEVLLQNFQRWILCFSCMLCLLTPIMLGILVWVVTAYAKDKDKECDVPLQLWAHVVFATVVYNLTINRPTPQGPLIVRLVCRWTRDPQNPQRTPARVRCYNGMVGALTFLWNCVGLHWVRTSGQDDLHRPACRATDLLNAVTVYASFNLAFTVFMYVNMVGFSQLLRIAMHRGLLRTSSAAPKGALEKNTELVQASEFQAERSTEGDKCSICLEDFADANDKTAANEIRRIKQCGHTFHRSCLQGWLNVNRNCPLCRIDLGTV
mmetsp:Transcript_106742/g.300011  ORF Transcript_106742/g.300011 Transcript_106742/m.300011 type:complete len:369 (-) Transcript_106742:120-1226(-)